MQRILALTLATAPAASAGQSWRWVAQKTGHFNYACAYHPTMLGSLSVQ